MSKAALTDTTQTLLRKAGIEAYTAPDDTEVEPYEEPATPSTPLVEASAPAFQTAQNTSAMRLQEDYQTYALNLERFSTNGNYFTIRYDVDKRFLRVQVTDNPKNARRIGDTHKVKLNKLVRDLLGIESPYNSQQYWYATKPVVDVYFEHDNFPLLQDHDLEVADISVPGASLVVNGNIGNRAKSVTLTLAPKIAKSLEGAEFFSVQYNLALKSVRIEAQKEEFPGFYPFEVNDTGELVIRNMSMPNSVAETFCGSDKTTANRRVDQLSSQSVTISF
jgi:hypothetical protein